MWKLLKIFDESDLKRREKLFADALILLALAFLFISPGLLDIGVFTSQKGSGSAITGMAVSGDYNDTYSVSLPLRYDLGREIQILTENELGGLNGGTIVTSLGTTNYNQYFRLSNFIGGSETMLNSPEIVYTESDNIGGYVTD